MSTMRYQDFDLAIELLATTPARDRRRLLASPAGQAGAQRREVKDPERSRRLW